MGGLLFIIIIIIVTIVVLLFIRMLQKKKIKEGNATDKINLAIYVHFINQDSQ